MKKYFSLSLMFSLALATGGLPQERADVVESITPSSAMLFLKTSRIKDLMVSVKFVVDNLLSPDVADKFNKKKDEFKNKTGVDPMNIESLKKAGVDVERSASFALYPKGKRNEERMIVFIPVLDEKTFPLKFAELLNKMAGDRKVDLYPAITEYREYRIFQINKDIFTTAMDGVFIVGSTGDIIRSVIDTKADNAGFLALDQRYGEYLARTKKNYDLRAYATRDFLKEILQYRRKPAGDKKDGASKSILSSALKTAPATEARYVRETAGGSPSADSERDKFAAGPSFFNSVDYTSLGARVTPASIDIDLAAQLNTGSGAAVTFIDVIKTGMTGRALSVRNATTYSFVSFDYNKIEELCKDQAPGCRHYTELKEAIRSDLGIDFQTEILPWYSGVLNIIAGQPKGSGGGYTFFLPMNDPSQGRKVWEKAASYLSDKYKGTERFGTAKIGGIPSFWYIDSRNNKTFLVCDNRGLYMGNDAELIGLALASRDLSQAPAGDDLMKRLGDNVFFLTYLKKESFFGTLLMLYAYRDRAIRGVVERMSDLSIICEKSDRFVSLALTINLLKRT